MLQTVIDELLDCWTGKDQARDDDFSPKMWTHALRHLPAYLASAGRWKDLIRIAGDGFLERKLVELKSLSLVDADSELVFLACMKVRDLAAAVRLVLRRSQAEQKAHTIEEEGVAEALFNAAIYTGNKALLQELLFWHELLPTPERRLKVLANLLTASTGDEWTTEILKAVVRSLPERGGTLSADLDLRRIMEAVLARGETNIGFAIGVLWPRFSSTAAVGDLSTIPTTWTKNNRPQTPTIADRLISVLEKVAPEQRTYWLRELSARLNHLPFERQWAVRVRIAQAQCSCGEFETARESFIAAHDALNRGIQGAKGTHAQEQFSKLLAVVVTYEALLHAALLSLPEKLRLEAEERIANNAEMLSVVQARVCESYLRFHGRLPAEAPSSADQCLSVAEALERVERALAPSDLDQVVARLLNGIANLPSSDVWAPLTRTVSVFAESDPATATEAYRVLKQAQ